MNFTLIDGLVEREGRLWLTSRGSPLGPAPQDSLLFVFGDLGFQPKGQPLSSSLSFDLRHRALRAIFPVVDVVSGDRCWRVAADIFPWRGLPGATLSSPLNLVALIDRLAGEAAGNWLDLRFEGYGPSQHLWRGPIPVGADPTRSGAFDGYVGKLAGEVVAGKWGPASRTRPEPIRPISAAASLPPRPTVPPSAIPGTVISRPSRRAWPVWPWLMVGLIGMGLPWTSQGGRALVFCCLLETMAAALSLAGGLRALALLQRLLAIPASKVRSLAMGPVSLEGRIKSSAPFPAIYAGVSCAWLRWEVQERVRDRNGIRWKAMAHGEVNQLPFHLDDGSGVVLVHPVGAEVDVACVTTSLSEAQRAKEWLLAEGASVFVHGTAQPSHEEDRGDLQEKLRVAKHDPDLRQAHSLPPTGDLTSEQWDILAGAVERQFREAAADQANAADAIFVGEAPGRPLLIVDRSRAQELLRLRWSAWGGLLGGGLCLTVALLAAQRLFR